MENLYNLFIGLDKRSRHNQTQPDTSRYFFTISVSKRSKLRR